MSFDIHILYEWEIRAWNQEKIEPSCKNHRHTKKLDAIEMTCYGDPEFIPYSRKIAEWVGPRHIRMLTQYELREVERSRFPRMEIIEQGRDPYIYTLRDLKTSARHDNSRPVETESDGRGAIFYFPS